jgi:hypothetical protein
MTEQIKAVGQEQYPFNVTWHGGQDDPMFTVRASTIEEFKERCALILEGWAAAQPAQEDTTEQPRAPVEPPGPPVEDNRPTCAYQEEGKPPCGQKMVWRTGTTNGRPWSGWFCPTRIEAHKPIWVPVKRPDA